MGTRTREVYVQMVSFSCDGNRSGPRKAIRAGQRGRNEGLTVNPNGNFSPSFTAPSSRLVSMNVLRHEAQKSNSFWPSSCFCSSERRYLDCVISNLPLPCRVTRHTRRFVPPFHAKTTEHPRGVMGRGQRRRGSNRSYHYHIPRSTARNSPVSSPVGQPKTNVGIIGCSHSHFVNITCDCRCE